MSRAKLQETRVADLLVVSLVLRTEGGLFFSLGWLVLGWCVREKKGFRDGDGRGKKKTESGSKGIK